MSDPKEELPSLEKLSNDIKGLKLLAGMLTLGGNISLLKGLDKSTYESIKNLEAQVSNMVSTLNKFNHFFSEHGWIAYEHMKFSVMESAIATYEKDGFEQAEQILIEYYTNDIRDYMFMLKWTSEFAIRYDLIQKAIQDHFEHKFYSSIPIFLSMIDGAVSDYAQTGFAADKTEVNAWDSIVGLNSGLIVLKSIYTKNRTKTTTEEIFLPYRNGILHGRDLNYGNIYVSCKSLGMLFAVNDWLIAKRTEEKRQQDYQTSTTPTSFKELAKKIQANETIKRQLEEWKPRQITIGIDIPNTGLPKDYCNNTPEQKIAEFYELWKNKNYGLMAKTLSNQHGCFGCDSKSEKKQAGCCRKMFNDKTLVSFEILELEDRAAAMARVLVKTNWTSGGCTKSSNLEFGLIYQDINNNSIIRGNPNGKWDIIPWNTRGLYD